MMKRTWSKIVVLFAGLAILVASSDLRGRRVETVALFPVEIDGLWGYIDKTAKVLIPPQFQEAASFSENLAAVAKGASGATSTRPGKW